MELFSSPYLSCKPYFNIILSTHPLPLTAMSKTEEEEDEDEFEAPERQLENSPQEERACSATGQAQISFCSNTNKLRTCQILQHTKAKRPSNGNKSLDWEWASHKEKIYLPTEEQSADINAERLYNSHTFNTQSLLKRMCSTDSTSMLQIGRTAPSSKKNFFGGQRVMKAFPKKIKKFWRNRRSPKTFLESLT